LFIANPFEGEEGGREANFIRFRVSGSTSLEIKVKGFQTGILVNKETTSKLTIRS
jgi:hypothetical protein